ncbi:olfactory receptor 51Q1-like [Phascolarctos cinereus]|uniref:Olfactory receptor 51Q1-like n=1 Tax=Phascolarctos cinereus TaxID=38626 RepID=A0A6P5IX50_PHACI|nr:olfactory receptor 51Q1-like [Phascolarctos cinereus]
MSANANTTEESFYFILTGVPGFEAVHIWISIPFFCLYMISLIGNTVILAVIWTESSLHQPMYVFLSMLTQTDLGLTLTTLPTVMRLLWFNARKISLEACFVQFFFLHGFSFMESSVLLAMAFDRDVAICHPLRYASILTDAVVRRIGMAIVIRCVVAVLPRLFLLQQLPFCHSHVLTHSYCLHQDMIRLVCFDTTINSWYGFGLVMVIYVLDPLLIVFSYALIFFSVLHAASPAECLRAFNNCLSHILAVLVLYVPMIGLSMVHRFARHASPLVHVAMANVYLLSPPVMNPIIYTVKTKQIHQRILHLLSQKKVY